jgi:hypothetical protein
MTLLKELNLKTKEAEEVAKLSEGIMSYSVVGSDTTADLYFGEVLNAVVSVLHKGLKFKGNKYNTTGAENVAMILLEKFKNDIPHNPKMAELARSLGKRFLDEADGAEKELKSLGNSETKGMRTEIKRFKKWGNDLLKAAT